MENKELPTYEANYDAEERKLADHIISLEVGALDKWFKGDTSGYRELWSKRSFSYFDGVTEHRIDDHENICKFLDTIEGKLFADNYEFCFPRVQFGKDIAVLTYQLYAKTTLLDMKYNCVEIYQQEDDEWHVIHSTWSFIRPMEMDFEAVKEIV